MMINNKKLDVAVYLFWFVMGTILIIGTILHKPKPVIRVKYDPPTSEEVGKATGKMSKGFTKGFVKGVLEKEEKE